MTKTTISITRKNGETIVSNNSGSEWTFRGRLDDATAIASIVFFTLNRRFEQVRNFSSDFSLAITLAEEINDGKTVTAGY